jgi:hypothetical protein
MKIIVLTWRPARYIDSYEAEGALLYTLTVLTPNFPATGYCTLESTSLVTIVFKKIDISIPCCSSGTPMHPPTHTRTLLGIPSH